MVNERMHIIRDVVTSIKLILTVYKYKQALYMFETVALVDVVQ